MSMTKEEEKFIAGLIIGEVLTKAATWNLYPGVTAPIRHEIVRMAKYYMDAAVRAARPHKDAAVPLVQNCYQHVLMFCAQDQHIMELDMEVRA